MKKNVFKIAFGLVGVLAYAQENDSLQVIDEVVFQEKLPITQSKIIQEELSKKNLGQDLPILLRNSTSVVSTSDAGAGVGYTYMRIRGVDQSRINVTLNGIPYNDAESQGVYWVDLPDIAGSTDNILIQRGVGTSSNGTAAFGGSVNLNTATPTKKGTLEIGSSIGSFNTHKHNLKFSSGKIGEYITTSGNISFIKSDGFIDRASSDLFSYAGQINYKKKNTAINFLTFGGREKTYQAWNGISKNQFENNFTYNSVGEISNGVYYDNEVDDYKQDHYQLNFIQKNVGDWKFNTTFNYTYGRGFYEQYKTDRDLNDYGLSGTETSDLITRKWLKNKFIAGNLKGNYSKNNLDLELGLYAGNYDGDHFGNIIWAKNGNNIVPNNYKWYNGNGTKNEISTYAKALYDLGDFNIFGDIQFRNVNYKIKGTDDDLNNLDGIINKKYSFINPKIGLNYQPSIYSKFYVTYGRSNREPNRSDLLNNLGNIKEETLNDFELGYKTNHKNFNFAVNGYYMFYNNQLVVEGIDDIGTPIKTQKGNSYRLGLELEGAYKINNLISVFGNTTLSKNKNKNWVEIIDDSSVKFGDTNTTYSPEIITNLGLEIKPTKGLSIKLINKYVGEQYLSNANYKESLLADYNLFDTQINYNFKNVFGLEEINFNLLVNNIFDKKYANNGYYWNYYDGKDGSFGLNHNPYYYAQAGTNFLAGLNIKL